MPMTPNDTYEPMHNEMDLISPGGHQWSTSPLSSPRDTLAPSSVSLFDSVLPPNEGLGGCGPTVEESSQEPNEGRPIVLTGSPSLSGSGTKTASSQAESRVIILDKLDEIREEMRRLVMVLRMIDRRWAASLLEISLDELDGVLNELQR